MSQIANTPDDIASAQAEKVKVQMLVPVIVDRAFRMKAGKNRQQPSEALTEAMSTWAAVELEQLMAEERAATKPAA